MPTPVRATTADQRARWQRAREYVGTAIRRARVEAGLTQEALAIEAELSRNMLIHLEHGTRAVTFDRLFDIAGALNVEVSSFFPVSNE